MNKQALSRQLHFMSMGIDACEALAKCLPDAIEQEQVTPEEVGSLLKCVSYSLLNTQRKMIREIQDG